MARADDALLPFLRRLGATVSLVALVAVVLLLAWQGARVLLLVFAGVLLAVLLRGMATWVAARTGLSSLRALAVVCVLSTLFVVGLLTFAAASITQQFSELIDQVPQALEQVRTQLAGNPLGERLLAPLESSGGDAPVTPRQVLGVASSTVGAVGTIVLVAFLGLFFAIEPGVYRRGLLHLVPQGPRDRLDEVLVEAGDVLLAWLAGRLFLMAVIGISTWLGLLLLGVPLALALGILAGLLSFIPNLGPVISAVPALLIAATIDPMRAVWVGALYLGLQTVESYVLEPLVVKRTVALPPAANIAFQLLMGTWIGIVGITLATPLLVVLILLVSRLYVEDVLGDDVEGGVSSGSTG